MRGHEPLWTFNRIGTAGKPTRGQLGGLQTIGAGASGMQGLAHRAEHRFQPGCHGAGDAKCGGSVVGVELHQARAGCGGAERAERGRGVKAPGVLRIAARQPQPTHRFVAGGEGGHEVAPACAARFGQGQQGRNQGHRGVAGAGHVDVVVIERVRGRAIDQGVASENGK